MKVSVLQQFLRSLAAPLQTAGAAKPAHDLELTCQALEPFADQDFAQLAASLTRAEEFHRTKLLPMLKSKSRASGRGAERTLNDAQIQHLAQQVKHLEQRAAGSGSQRQELGAELDQLGLENLNKQEAITLAKEIGLQTRVRMTAQDVHQLLRRLILEGREALQNPAPQSSKPVDAAKVQHLAQQVRQLEEKAASADASLQGLNSELDHIGLDGLNKEDALALAKELGVNAASRSSATELVVQIRRSVLDRKESLETARV